MNHIRDWLEGQGKRSFEFQEETWKAMQQGKSGLVNAPTGCGKTYSVFLGALIRFMDAHPTDWKTRSKNGLQLMWITPLRALAKDIARAMEEAVTSLGMAWQVGIRNGDTPNTERQKQKQRMPEILVITPESLHLLLASKGYPDLFAQLQVIAVDEWHELLGSKRGVQVELAISRIAGMRGFSSPFQVWGLSATIGNMEEAADTLMAPLALMGYNKDRFCIIRTSLSKRTELHSIFPDQIETYPWSGHLGIKLAHKVIPIVEQSRTTLIFINTRGMSETWYQTLLQIKPDWAGAIALHHGSIEQALRLWVEDALHEGVLKAVVCTASLDLGVDFRPVETVIQVGSPKGVSRFLQRAGRSGHQPGATSHIWFLPTHSLELVEAAALKEGMSHDMIESKEPKILCFDVLVQWLCTLAVGEGFRAEDIWREVRATQCFREMTEEEWRRTLQFVVSGGQAMQQYDEFQKVEIIDGVYRILNRRTAMRHRLHIGTIVSDPMLKVRLISGGYVGMIEEYFISRFTPGEVFTLAGRTLEFVMIKDMTVLVRKSNAKKSIVPSWQGGRMPLSANLGRLLRAKLEEGGRMNSADTELKVLKPLFALQQELSHVPGRDELLIEQIETKDGFHLFVHSFEGRLVNEALAAILAWRISRIRPMTFSFAMNDYSFELLSDQPIPVDDSNVYELFSTEHLSEDIQRSVNSTEMAKRKFRDIAVIGGLIFTGMPGEQRKARHLQSSASLLFQVFRDYDPQNLLLRQAYQEVYDTQMEEARLREMLERVSRGKIVLTWPEQLTPFSFPVKVDSMREALSSEKLEDRIRRMQDHLTANKNQSVPRFPPGAIDPGKGREQRDVI